MEASSCSTTARSAPATSATTSAVEAISSTSGTSFAVPAWQPPGRSRPPGQRPRGPLAPFRHGSERPPGDDASGADLGEDLDRQLATVALRDRLDDDDLGHRSFLAGDLLRDRGQHPLAGRGDDGAHRRPGPVGEHEVLPDPQPAYGDRVVGLVTLDRHLGADPDAGERRHDVDEGDIGGASQQVSGR